MEKQWTEKMFVDKAQLYGPTLETLIERVTVEVNALIKIFSEYQVPSRCLVLDLACGIGRHSVLLAEKGYKVVGVDISPEFIARAKGLAADKEVTERVDFRVGDMRRIRELLIGYEGAFDVVLNLFTSMGYWNEQTDRKILRQLLNLTAPNGTFIFDMANRDWIVCNFQDRYVTYGQDGRVQTFERKLDLESSRMYNVWRFYRKEGDDLKHLGTFELDHRIYSLHELRRQVEASGWTYQTCYGGYDLEPFTMDSRRILLVAKKL